MAAFASIIKNSYCCTILCNLTVSTHRWPCHGLSISEAKLFSSILSLGLLFFFQNDQGKATSR